MEIGSVMWNPVAGSVLNEIHRVFGGWIYVYQFPGQLSTQFVPEELNINRRAVISHG